MTTEYPNPVFRVRGILSDTSTIGLLLPNSILVAGIFCSALGFWPSSVRLWRAGIFG